MRRLQMEASQRAAEQAQAINDVKEASVVITNPTHFAVAIKYQPNENDVPIIIAMGKDSMAFRVIEQAELNSISVVRSPLLARALTSGDPSLSFDSSFKSCLDIRNFSSQVCLLHR